MRASKTNSSFQQPQLTIDNLSHNPSMNGNSLASNQSMAGLHTKSIHQGISVMANIDRSKNGSLSASQQFISTRQMMQMTRQQTHIQAQVSRQGNQGEQEVPELQFTVNQGPKNLYNSQLRNSQTIPLQNQNTLRNQESHKLLQTLPLHQTPKPPKPMKMLSGTPQ